LNNLSNWDTKKVSEVVSKINDNTYVLPVIQRRLVWEEDKMINLFDTLLKGNSFGGIMAIQEEEDNSPLFAYRHFTRNGELISSTYEEKNKKDHLLIIDGQQRLQTFYIGLLGSLNGKMLYFDLHSDYQNLDYEFKFEIDSSKLPKLNNDRDKNQLQEHFWYPVSQLYKQLKETHDDDQITDTIIKKENITSNESKETIRKNVNRFYRSLFNFETVGICKVNINRSLDDNFNRQRIVELFRRLNDGGTRLSSFDLVASTLKGFDWKMENFLETTLQDYNDIGLTQEHLIKLLFLLKDNYRKEMSDLESQDASFAIENKERIVSCLKALKIYLKSAKLYNYYVEGNRSFIPLYFIVYHLFHKKSLQNGTIEHYFDNYDTNNKDFSNISKWLYWSLLNQVFSRGRGWIPYKTGVRELLEVLSNSKDQTFPVDQIFNVYYRHPLNFRNVISDNLTDMDTNFILYILYNREVTTRKQDIDHVHPYNLLSWQGVNDYKINNIANYQLLDYKTNRGLKNGKPLGVWIENHVANVDHYLAQHLIPTDPATWKIENFDSFLEQRNQLIINKINFTINTL